MKQYSAIDVADYIVERCAEKGTPVSNLQLQKILYYVQLNFLRKFDTCAFSDEIQAWRHGPVVREVYYKYNVFGRHAIIPKIIQTTKNIFLEKDRDLIDKVTDACMRLDLWELVERSHKVGGPWHQSFDGDFDKIISKEVMAKYAREH